MMRRDLNARGSRRAGFACAHFTLILTVVVGQSALADGLRPVPRDVSLGVMVALAMGAAGEADQAPAANSTGVKQGACAAGFHYRTRKGACQKLASTRGRRALSFAGD